MATTQLLTIDDALAMELPEFWELIEGELFDVSPANPWSSIVAGRILTALSNFVNLHDLGYVLAPDAGLILEVDPDSLVAPDVSVVLRESLVRDIPRQGFANIIPDLAVEVISPSDDRRRIRKKRELYSRVEVPLVWWVDPETAAVTIVPSTGQERIVGLDGALEGGEVLPGFTLKVSEIFRD